MEQIILTLAVSLGIVLNTLLCVFLWKRDKEKHVAKALRLPTLLGGVFGLALGVLLCRPLGVVGPVLGALSGVFCGQGLFLLCHCIKKAYQMSVNILYDNGQPPRFFITGDKHRRFHSVARFCHDMNTTRKDVLIVLGDAGFNYYEDKRDDALKKEVAALNITLFCLHGNKENRPQNVGTYGLRDFCGGKVYYEPRYPNILFAIDGEIYRFDGRNYLVVGGAHSVDKLKCLGMDLPFFEDEMPSDETKELVEQQLAEHGNRIYGMLTHTCPLRYLPTEMFLSTKEAAETKRKPKKKKKSPQFPPDIDRSTEEWLDKLEQTVDYCVWFCGHYHIDKQIDKITMMHSEIKPLYSPDDLYHCF
jgi:3-oxoacid CoA-transferase subunit A